MLPVLRDARDGDVRIGETVARLPDQFGLSQDQLAQRVPSGQQTVFGNRVSWAKSHLAKAGLIDMTRRACFCINDRGR
ncbi:winged helix-turn-helix domain-containing protein [Sphingomonas arantia]|uniref:Winged helix-turn-helix domain-containing protein n=1 Tax=Sphingomonas arantia TaxID=1460676 RepID=A0ABW4TTI4_9SPHN